MDIIFSYSNSITGYIELMNGVFYDADLDTALTNQAITESLTLKTTDVGALGGTGLNILMEFPGGAGWFSVSKPITGITSNTTSKKTRLFYSDPVGNGYFTAVGSNNDKPITFFNKTFEVFAEDGEGDTSDTLSINAKVVNYLPSFSVRFLDEHSDEISSINIENVGDIFKIEVGKVEDVEDGNDYLRDVAIADMAEYVKLQLISISHSKEDPDDLDLPGFDKSLYYDIDAGTLTITYTCSSLINAQAMGSKNIRVMLYDEMGHAEQAEEEDLTLHKNRTIDGNFTLNIASENVVIEAIDTGSSISIGGEVYQGAGDDFAVSETVDYIEIPFMATTVNDQDTWAIGATVGRYDTESLHPTNSSACYIRDAGITTSYQSGGISVSDDIVTYTNFDIDTNSVLAVVRIPKKALWWGVIKVTVYVGVGSNGSSGIGSKEWTITVNNVNQSPSLLIS